MGIVNVLVRHERQDWRATTVNIEGSTSEDTKELVRRAREYLLNNDYQTYCFVTEYPQSDPNAKGPVIWLDLTPNR